MGRSIASEDFITVTGSADRHDHETDTFAGEAARTAYGAHLQSCGYAPRTGALYGNGSYILTNDANFEPWRDLQLEGRRLDPTR